MPRGAKNNLTGLRFGRLLVVGDVGKRQRGNILWECRCDCGNSFYAKAGHLRDGTTVSCGCFRSENWIANIMPKMVAKVSANRMERTRITGLICDCSSSRERNRQICQFHRAVWFKYKLTPTALDEMHSSQQGLCKFCGAPYVLNRGRGKLKDLDSMVIDHCHTTNAVRGLVHHRCNLLIGYAENVPMTVDDIAINLRKYLAA